MLKAEKTGHGCFEETSLVYFLAKVAYFAQTTDPASWIAIIDKKQRKPIKN